VTATGEGRCGGPADRRPCFSQDIGIGLQFPQSAFGMLLCVRRALVLLVSALALIALGCDEKQGSEPSLKDARKELAGAPRALAALHAQANELLGGGVPAFRTRLASLRGRPIVVNKWGSWCAPCRFESPVLARVSVKLGRQVAFLGVDGRDHDDAARRYLKAHPLSYPSYTDPRDRIARAIRAPQGFPITNFYDRGGRLVFQHAGPYAKDKALERDIAKYLHA
jgi:cytochrome c biogenesis protein CcmG, thiol:disulfide interchange protein DsbE